MVEGTGQGSPPVCTFDPGGKETSFANVDPAVAEGNMGVVIVNQLTQTQTLNPLLRTDSTSFNPHQVVADYEVIGGQTVTNQIIPVSGGSINGGGGSAVVITPFFSPAAAKALSGTVRVTFHVEGTLDDGTTVHTTEHEYIFVTCATANCTSTCL
jgi:glyceraldehyde-3-phosphate dehydrogenase/erythrose-4-phosphate dehydrogenase